MSAVLEAVQAPPIDRSKFLGGSDIGAILGVSPYRTPVALWMEKRGMAPLEEPNAARDRVRQRGKRLEPIVVDMVVDKLLEQGHEVELLARNKRYIDPVYPFLACEIDFELRLDGEHVNGDSKTVHGFARAKWGAEETDQMPIEHAAQFAHGLGVCPGKRPRCLVAALIGLDDVKIYWAERDEETIDAIRAKAVAFWQMVQEGIQPEPIEFEDVTALYPRHNGSAIEATSALYDKVYELKNIRERIRELERRDTELKLAIGSYILPHERLTYLGADVATFREQEAERLDQELLKRIAPDVYKAFLKKTPSRVLRLKK